MKKSASLLSLLFVLVSAIAFAQTATDDATVNVRLYPIQTILVNGSQKIVNLDYKSTDDYKNGVKLDESDHLTVYSTGAFAVKVKSSGAQLASAHSGITEKIDASDIKLTPSLGSQQLTGSTLTSVTLSQTPTTIIASNIGGVNKTFNVQYAAAGANSYINKYFNVESPTTYTTSVVYTIEAL